MWPFSRRPKPVAPAPAPPSPDAEAALRHATRALLDAQNLDRKVERVTREAAEIKRINHIAAAVARSIRGA